MVDLESSSSIVGGANDDVINFGDDAVDAVVMLVTVGTDVTNAAIGVVEVDDVSSVDLIFLRKS